MLYGRKDNLPLKYYGVYGVTALKNGFFTEGSFSSQISVYGLKSENF